MKKHVKILTTSIILFSLLLGCTGLNAKNVRAVPPTPSPLNTIQQIDSFNPIVASRQALEVINKNVYGQEFFEKVFERVVEQCRNSTSPKNAEIIWQNLVAPLKQSGKVPPDLAKSTWNFYFSKQFVSLPDLEPITGYCYDLSVIKNNLEKEYQLKKEGFEICQQGSPDAHFLNAMYVYNTMWAVCNGTN